MNENTNTEEEVDLRESLYVLWRGKYFVIIFTIISILAGVLFIRNADSIYKIQESRRKLENID